MPPTKKYQKEDIINITYELVKSEGLAQVNARRIAKELGCSVQPIFHNFSNMDELMEIVYRRIYDKYREYMLSGIDKEKAYKEMGLSYIRFAKDYPEFFKILFMQKTNYSAENFIMADSAGEDVIKTGQKLTGLSFDEQKKFHVKVWIFTHGIACLIATKTIDFSEEEISDLLGKTVLEMFAGLKLGKS